ncbi:hypothetical protein HDU80_000151 [Chytriomyces hyalinus]|nr:hypothetical protein HDU80_000151 [Chytriomyces hyalinus]
MGPNVLFFDEIGIDWDPADKDHQLLKALSDSASEDLFQHALEQLRWLTASRSYVQVFGCPTLILETDASALKGMVNNPAITDATMLRWILYISTFPVVWHLIKGKLHRVPDGLSRIFSKPPEEADAANDSGDVEDAIEAMLGLVAACQKEEIVESEAERLWGVFSNRMEASRVFVADFLQYEEDV